MSCPTCSHTMHSLGETETGRRWWCPRCGTLKTDGRFEGVDTPKLVERCRLFEATFPPGNPRAVSYSAEWRRLGIAEAINTPGDRPC